MKTVSYAFLAVVVFSSITIAASIVSVVFLHEPRNGGVVSADITELWSYDSGNANAVVSGITLADVDMDGELEAIAGTWGNDRVHVVNAEDGSYLWSVSVGNRIRCTPAVGDIDGDLQPEVVFSSWDEKTYALDGEDGTQIWSRLTGSMAENGVCLGSINNDTTLDVIVGNTEGTVYALNGVNGSILWSATLARGVRSTPAIGDIDQDGELEVVVCTVDSPSYVYSLSAANGTIEWSLTEERPFCEYLALADLDADGQVEVVATTSYVLSGTYDGRLLVINGTDGSDVWTRNIGASPHGSPSVGDIDGNGRLEVAVGTTDENGTYLRVFDHSGSQKYVRQLLTGVSTGIFTPILADLNRDERLDVLLATETLDSDAFLLGVEGRTGSLLYAHSVYVDTLYGGAVGDADSDGCVDFVLGSCEYGRAGIICYDLGSSGRGLFWQSYGGVPDTHTGCLTDIDPDTDGLSSDYETSTGTDESNWDTDSDLMADGYEAFNGLDNSLDDSAEDGDLDGLTNLEEFQAGAYPDSQDSDADGLDDYEEVFTYHTDPAVADTDSDSMLDNWEVEYGFDPLDDGDASQDSDSDGLTNLQEYGLGTNPNLADTDSDGIDDGTEVEQGFDPLVSNTGVDSDSDGLDDAAEVELGTSPANPDSDSDGLSDGWEVSRGLDPLAHTDYTGEGIERIVIAAAVCGAMAALGWALVKKGAPKFRFLSRLERHRLYVPSAIFLCCVLVFAAFDVHGPVDPGFNEQTTTSHWMDFQVSNSPYFSHTVGITVWYEMHYFETCYVILVFARSGETKTVDLVIESTSSAVQREYDYGSVSLEAGLWGVSVSTSLSRTVHVELEQTHIDGRNEDQKIWQSARIAFAAIGLILLIVPYSISKRKPNRMKPEVSVSLHVSYNLVGTPGVL